VFSRVVREHLGIRPDVDSFDAQAPIPYKIGAQQRQTITLHQFVKCGDTRVEVLRAQILVTISERGLLEINSNFVPEISLPSGAVIDEKRAAEAARVGGGGGTTPPMKLVVRPHPTDRSAGSKARLVYVVLGAGRCDPFIHVDAFDGTVVGEEPNCIH